MSLWVWVVAASLATQSLGEVAERERERREKIEEAGIEIPAFTIVGDSIEREEPERAVEVAPAAPEAVEEDGSSPLDEARERGKILEPEMAAISGAADRVDWLYERYLNECYGRYLVGETPPGIGLVQKPPPPVHAGVGRDWFVVLETPSAFTVPVPRGGRGNVALVEPPRCEALRHELLDSADAVRRAMQELLGLARRERILPGVVRELREKYRLDWPGWER